MIRAIYFMGYRISCSKCLITCLVFTFIVGLFIASLPIKSEKEVSAHTSRPARQHLKFNKNYKLAIIVPFRDRFEELLEFVPHMNNFLNKQKLKFDIFVVQQIDDYRFNRASLINVGYLVTKDNYDYFAMHDVDLLPLNDNLKYSFPALGPLHISTPDTHPKYWYDTFIGGILLINMVHYEMVNGMSNNYWGWGLEDDEFYVRLKDAGLKVERPSNITTGPTNTFKHVRDNRKRDKRKCFNQREVTRRRDRVTGLSDVRYNVNKVHNVTIDGFPATVFNVYLKCDKNVTPWCICPPNIVEKEKNKT